MPRLQGTPLTPLTLRSKQWLVAAAAWPISYLVFGIAILALLKPKRFLGATPPDPWPLWFQALVALHVGTLLLGGAVVIFCLVYLFKYSALKGVDRLFWALLLAFGGIVSAPLFVWWHVHPVVGVRSGPREE